MNYQSFLSAILENKYYTLQEINELSLTIQRNSGTKIISRIQPQGQIFLQCPYRHNRTCPYTHIFKKVEVLKGIDKFQLMTCTQKHSIQCGRPRKATNQNSKPQNQQNLFKSTSNVLSTDQTSHLQTSEGSPMSKDSIMNISKPKSSIQENMEKRLYTQDQFSLLKKQLQLQSKGLLSKSTEFELQPNNNLIRRIQFHCKYENHCPYQALLTLNAPQGLDFQSRTKILYSLEVLNLNHLPQCLLDQEIVNFNQNTMKIDKQINLLARIIEENPDNLKPKEILKKLAQQLGENEEFIYNGLTKNINKRAIKKYFDNSVAKVRTRVFSPTKNPKTKSSINYQPILRKDQGYFSK